MYGNRAVQNKQVKGDGVPEGISYEFENNVNKLPSEDMEFHESDDDTEQVKNKNLVQQQLPTIQEESSVHHQQAVVSVTSDRPSSLQIYGIVLVKEIKNPNNQRLSRKDTASAFNTIFKMMTRSNPLTQNLPLPQLNMKEIVIEPILSSGILKGSVIINTTQEMFDLIMHTPYCSQTLYDRLKGIEREFTFNFYDLDKIYEKHKILQTGRFSSEFVQVMTDKIVSGRKTTQILFSMHIRDGQIYAIKKVKLGSLPSWERIYTNQVHEIREIRAMLRLSHKNVLRLFSWWMEEEFEEVLLKTGDKKQKKQIYLYMQTEYLAYKDQSSDLLEFIHVNFEHLKMPIPQRRQKMFMIFNQVLDGVEYIHEQGFFHRDIKPENILVTENCWGEILIKICDFDFAKNISDEGGEGQGQGVILQSRTSGTEGYTTPKSARGQLYDTKEEIFMLGMVLLDLCKLYPEAANRKLYHSDAGGKDGKGSKLPESVTKTYPEETALFRAMAVEQQFSSIRKLRESKLWAAYKASQQ